MTDSVVKADQQSHLPADVAWRLYPYGFETQLNADFPTIVLLHGWGMTQQVWRRLIPYLQSQCNVLCVDLPGFGESAGLISVRSIDQVIDALLPIVPQRALYVGWSLGGNIALEIARQYPQRVHAVVTIASNPSFLARCDWPGMSCEEYENFQHGLAGSATKILNRFALLQAKGEQLQRQTHVELRSALSLQSERQVLTNTLNWLGEFDQRADLKNLTVPGLFILGEQDPLVPASIAERLPENIAVTVLSGTGHAPLVSMPEKIAMKVLDFAEQENLLAHASASLNKHLVASSFGRSAKTYDQAAGLQRDVADELLAYLPDSFQGTVADLGCGTGYCIAQLAQRDYSTPYAIDIAEPMLRFARDQHQLNAWYVAADAEAIPLADNSIDLMVSSLAVQWCEHLPLLFAEIQRVLKPEGRCYITTFGQNTLHELRSSWQSVDDYSHVNRFYPANVLRNSAEQQGLSVSNFERKEFVLRYENILALARELKAIGAHNINQGRPKGLLGRGRLQALEAAYDRYRDSDGLLPASYEVYFACYQKPGLKGA